MTWFRWWHRLVRLYSKPKLPEDAEKWTRNLSTLYAFFGWNALGLIFYQSIKTHRESKQEKLASTGQQVDENEIESKTIQWGSLKMKMRKLNPQNSKSQVPEGDTLT